MKNNLILGLQGFTKVLTGTIFVVALVATSFAYTKQSTGNQPQRQAARGGQVQRRSVPAARGGRAARVPARGTGSSTSTSSAAGAGAGQTPTTTAQATPVTLAEKVEWVR